MNIIFDFGRVVFTWDPKPFVEKYFQDPETRLMINCEIFDHPDWLEIDRGTLTLEQLAVRAAKRTQISSDCLLKMLYNVPDILQPIPETVLLLGRLKKRQHTLYALSNMGEYSMTKLEKINPFLEIFDGMVISSEIKLVKPDPAIFHHLLHKFGIKAQESVFIDDHAPNIHTAASLGFHTIHFTTPRACELQLIDLGCL